MKTSRFHNLNGELKEQLLVTCDQKGITLGLATREECHQGAGRTHLAFMAFVVDKDGKIVLTKRSRKKSLWGGFWDASAVSHVLEGETPEDASNRRGKEELGVDVRFKSLGAFYYFAKHLDRAENEYCFCLTGKTDGKVFPNPVEIDQVKKITVAELKKEIANHPDQFTPWLKIALEKFDIL